MRDGGVSSRPLNGYVNGDVTLKMLKMVLPTASNWLCGVEDEKNGIAFRP